MNIEDEIRNGNFVVGECINCKKIIWPPADYCNNCFNKITNKKIHLEGKIVEFSRKGDDYFALVEFEKEVKLIGKILRGTPTNNHKVKMEKCGIRDGNYFFEFSLI